MSNDAERTEIRLIKRYLKTPSLIQDLMLQFHHAGYWSQGTVMSQGMIQLSSIARLKVSQPQLWLGGK